MDLSRTHDRSGYLWHPKAAASTTDPYLPAATEPADFDVAALRAKLALKYRLAAMRQDARDIPDGQRTYWTGMKHAYGEILGLVAGQDALAAAASADPNPI